MERDQAVPVAGADTAAAIQFHREHNPRPALRTDQQQQSGGHKAVPIRDIRPDAEEDADARDDADYGDYDDSSELLSDDEWIDKPLDKTSSSDAPDDAAETASNEGEHKTTSAEFTVPPSSRIHPPPPAPPAPSWRDFPQLLAPPTPPGKRFIVAEPYQPPEVKAVDNHRVSYGLTAASVYARLQPSLRQKNGTGGLRQKTVPSPYRRRPVSPSSTASSLAIAEEQEEIAPEEDEPELEQDEKDVLPDEEELEEDEPEVEFVELEAEDRKTTTLEDDAIRPDEGTDAIERRYETDDGLPEIQSLDNQSVEEEQTEAEEEKSPPQKISPPPVENETVKLGSSSSPAPAVDPVDIKSLLRSSGPLSLSEILQQKGLSLAELLKGGSKVAPVAMGISTTTTEPTDTTTTTITTTTARPDVLPSVQPISLRELLAAKNLSLQEIIRPALSSPEPPPSSSPTLKPGVKLPVPFNAGRAKGLAGLVAPPAPTEPTPVTTPTPESENSSPIPPVMKPAVDLKPLTFGSKATIDQTVNATSTTTTTTTVRTITIKSKIPYVPGGGVGEYGTHVTFDDEDDEENNGTSKSLFNAMVNSYGNQRPIATSRLTPAPPRKSRPVLNFNYNALSDEDEEDGESDATTPVTILTHFNEEELFEDDAYFNLPLSVRSAIIVSSAIGGLCLVVFLVILVVFKIKQKSRIRLRHPAALLGLAGAANGLSAGGSGGGSDSSGITTPVSHPANKSGYAKLPQRSSSLWGTLRRSVRQMDSVNYS